LPNNKNIRSGNKRKRRSLINHEEEDKEQASQKDNEILVVDMKAISDKCSPHELAEIVKEEISNGSLNEELSIQSLN
jgi:hypothetical protein